MLEGITRDTVMRIAASLGHEVIERDFSTRRAGLRRRGLLHGTAAEIVPIREVDDHTIGEPGPLTREIQRVFHDAIVSGRSAAFADLP